MTASPATTRPTSSPPMGTAELAQSITDRPYLSWSQAQRYQMCPLSYAFQYVDQADPEFTPSALVFGGAFHSAVSMHNEAQLEGVETPAVNQLMELFRDDMEPVTAPIKFNKTEDMESLMDLGRRMLVAFFESDLSKPEGTVVMIEDSVAGSIDDELPDISGKVDLVTLTAEGTVITDYKTTRSSWSETKPEEQAGQLRLYGELLKGRFDSEIGVAKLQFITISKAKTPKVAKHVVEMDDQKLEATRDQLREVWKGIAAGVFPARPGWQCKTCPFQGQCDSAAV